jgi:hypothetical protein
MGKRFAVGQLVEFDGLRQTHRDALGQTAEEVRKNLGPLAFYHHVVPAAPVPDFGRSPQTIG